LVSFAKHSYWLRTWIAQEIVLGEKVLVVAGDEVIELDGFGEFTERLKNIRAQSRQCLTNF
jgi:hypothetical protein